MSRTSSSSCYDDAIDEGEEKFHPFIQAELETLNLATQSVNTLEARLEETRILFIEINKERTTKLDEIVKKIGKCVEKARPYYEAKARQKALQMDVQRAAQMFERACNTVEAAKEMVQLAEQSIINIGTLDGNWQEVLNHATERVLKAEREKGDSEQVHRIHAEELTKIALYSSSLERSIKNCITKSAAYFELLQSYNEKLEAKKQEIRELETSLQSAKQTYSLALSTLENISNIIHQRRQALREKRLQAADGHSVDDEKPDPLLLDVPDLIRQLTVSSLSSSPRQLENPPSSSLVTTIHASHSAVAVNSSISTTPAIIGSNPGSPFIYTPSARPVQVPLKSNTTIRAGVVISAADLLRSIGLVHLADTMPQQPSSSLKPQQSHQQQYLKSSAGKGLTSSSSSYSLPIHTSSSDIAQESTSSKSGGSRPKQVMNNKITTHSQASTPPSATIVTATPSESGGNPTTHHNNYHSSNPIAVSCPSPSLSDISTGSSTTASSSNRRVFTMHHDHSDRSSETEDLPVGNGSEDTGSNNGNNNNNKTHQPNLSTINSANSIMSVTPTSTLDTPTALNAPETEAAAS